LPAHAEGTVVAGTFGDWTLNVYDGKSSKICFVTAAPAAKEPSTAGRASTLFYISAWPKDGIKTEVSVKLGYKVKAGSEITVAVDKESFRLFPSDERAYVADATQELKLVEALKKGSKAKVLAVTERGVSTTDNYSLQGLSQALQALAGSCP
jgi:invasion protein IalB